MVDFLFVNLMCPPAIPASLISMPFMRNLVIVGLIVGCVQICIIFVGLFWMREIEEK